MAARGARVIVVQPIAEAGIMELRGAGCAVDLLADPGLESLMREVVDADAVLVRTAEIPREVIERGERLRVIARHGAGVDNIDLEAATERGIQVTNAPRANPVSVAEHVLGLMLNLAKKINRADRALRRGHFRFRDEELSFELRGRNLGVIGLGRIGRKVGVGAARGFEMEVSGYDPHLDPGELPPEIEPVADRERLIARSDFISLNLPLTPSTRHTFGEREFELMKETAFLINCARGGVVDEGALIAALREDRIAGAALDVFSREPPEEDSPLLAMENTVLTPHMAAHSREAMERMAVHAARGIIEILEGREPTWPVNRV